MAAYQLSGNFPAVSVRSASMAKKDCQRNYEWVDSFDNVIIAFDMDEAGQAAANKVANIFAGKSKIMHLGEFKDTNDMLLGGNGEADWKRAFWNAETYTPDGIVAGNSLWESVNTPVEKARVAYPWDGLNDITYGIRDAELVTLCSGSGMGKSQMVRELASHILHGTDDNIGMMMLEETIRKTALGFMSTWANKPLHLPTTIVSDADKQEAFNATMGKNRIFLFDHFGSTSVDNILSRLRYLNKAMGCQFCFLDHLSIIVSAQDNGDERKAIDSIMTKLRMLVQATGMTLFLVSHLKRPDGKGHEEGGQTSLSQLRGSASIAQLSDIVIGLERDGQHEDITIRNTTTVRVLKNRFSGETGHATSLLYDKATGRMEEIDPEEIEAAANKKLEKGL